MIVREQTLITETVEAIRIRLPFPMLGLDVDNDSAFINETVLNYCKGHQIELTRSRAYKKNDQAWIEQKNGEVVRRMVGYGRLEGVATTATLAELHKMGRLYVNFFQPSFKLKAKTREGAKVTKKYYLPATPHERLLADQRVTEDHKQKLRQTFATLDPVYLLSRIRECQRKLTQQQVRGGQEQIESARELSHFIESLSTAWRGGEIRPTHRKPNTQPRAWRTRADPFQEVWPLLQQWLNNQPDKTLKSSLKGSRHNTPTSLSRGNYEPRSAASSNGVLPSPGSSFLAFKRQRPEIRNDQRNKSGCNGGFASKPPGFIAFLPSQMLMPRTGAMTRPSLVWPLSQRSGRIPALPYPLLRSAPVCQENK